MKRHHRVRATVADLSDALGGDRPLVVGREAHQGFRDDHPHDAGGGRCVVCCGPESRARRIPC